MEKISKLHSCVKPCGGVPTLFVNGSPFPAAAYMTYLEKFNRYDDFAGAGYGLFSVPVLFAGRWISAADGLTPFKKGIFDEKGKPDFSLFDEAIEKITAACPDALVIPRVNISMPEWWERENPDCVNILPDGRSKRESLYSEKWREDAAGLLRRFVRYVEGSKYASKIAGYHIAGGNTEEWFHFDLNAGACRNAEKGFKNFLSRHYPGCAFRGIPELAAINSEGAVLNDDYLSLFLEYASFAVADAISYFARTVKEETGGRVVVGTFYGYSLEVSSPLWGTHSLGTLLNDENIDFISSPNSYMCLRPLDCDSTEMYPADSVRLHGKMCFQECDIRTNLTVLLGEKDPSTDPNGILSSEIWKGPSKREEAESLIKKSFARQLIKGNGFWWFDMWGGWYADEKIMSGMKKYREIYGSSLLAPDRSSIAETAVFSDESSFRFLKNCRLRDCASEQRMALGRTGVPYDMFDMSDFEAVCGRYKAVILMSGHKTQNTLRALEICEKTGLPYLAASEQKPCFSAAELREFFAENGVFCCCETDDIVYINAGYAAIIALSDGEKTIKLPQAKRITEPGGSKEGFVSDTVKVSMKRGEIGIYAFSREKI